MSSGAPPSELADGKLLVDGPADGVVRLTISNPAKRNALDHPILDAITATLAELAPAESGAHCVIITGAHGMFSAGYDIGEIPAEEFQERAEKLVAHPFTEAIDALEAFPYPTLAMLPGHTIGGGLELALACDMRVALDPIKLGMPPGKLGLVYSHTGLRRFIDAIEAGTVPAKIVAVISNKKEAPALERARRHGLSRTRRNPVVTKGRATGVYRRSSL